MSEPDGAGMDPEIRAFIIKMMPQARSEAWKRYQAAPHALDLDELTSLAYTGLMMAAVRWPLYCSEKNFSSGCGQVPCADPENCGAHNYFAAYSLRRIRGAMLDAMRSSDWVTRSTRARAKLLRDAGQDLGRTEAELSAATGLSPQQIRDTSAGVSVRPVSFDAGTHDVADSGDVGEQVAVASILESVVAVMDTFGAQAQVILALRYHQDRGFGEIAAALGITEQQVLGLHNEAVQAIHNVMLKAVT